MKIKKLIKDHFTLVKYMLAAFTGSVLNFITAYIFYIVVGLDIIVANSIGLIVGFLWTFIASKLVFHKQRTLRGFAIYLGTFVLGMVMANLVIKYAAEFFGRFLSKKISFMISKVLSGFLPFLSNYIIRKRVFKKDFV